VADSAETHTIECVGCRGRVPDIEGPIHRYMTASPGCWQAYTELMAGGLPPNPRAGLSVDAYAVTHPGVPGPQSTPSVWIHLVTLCCTLERGWPIERAVFLRTLAADSFRGWSWLERPDRMGDVTVIDLAGAVRTGDLAAAVSMTTQWVEGAWSAWERHHSMIRARATELVATLD
jgi:Family of unknown function (DUF5946)